ncbi:hypothetical protein QCA50_008340 [Cerrena zonata]|uniref:Uncharacterized protein n=1 Tax=Cerrena zonata TaxID=2478898 RepID=A0AAW0G5Q5_9APHY
MIPDLIFTNLQRTYVFQDNNSACYDITDASSVVQFAALLLEIRHSLPELHAQNLPVLADIVSTSGGQPDEFDEVSLVVDPNFQDSEGLWTKWTKTSQGHVPANFRMEYFAKSDDGSLSD